MALRNDTIWSLSVRLTSSFHQQLKLILFLLDILWFIALSLQSPNSLAYFFMFPIPRGVPPSCFNPTHLSSEHCTHMEKAALFEVSKVSVTWYPENSITLDYIMFALGVKGRILGSQNVSKSTTKNRKYWFMLDQIQAVWRVLMMHLHSLCSISQKHLSTASNHPENPERGYAATAHNKNLKMCCVLIILRIILR